MTNQQQSPISISQNQFGDVYIDVVNQGHFTNRSARQIYKDIVEKNLNQENTLYVVIGSDSGLFPKHIENFEKTPTGTNYLFIELDSLYDLMLGQLNGMIMNKCIVANIHDWEDWFNQEGFEKYIYDEKVLIVN